LILHLGNLFLIVQLHFSKLFLILKYGVNHTSRGSISTSTLPSIKLRKCSSKIITSILSFISGRLATKSNQIKRSEERFSRNAETDLVCRLLLEKKQRTIASQIHGTHVSEGLDAEVYKRGGSQDIRRTTGRTN